VFGCTSTYLKRRGKPSTDKEEQSIGQVVMMSRSGSWRQISKQRTPHGSNGCGRSVVVQTWPPICWRSTTMSEQTTWALPKCFAPCQPVNNEWTHTHTHSRQKAHAQGWNKDNTSPKGHLPKQTLQNRGLLSRILFRTRRKIRGSHTAKDRQRHHRGTLFRPLKWTTSTKAQDFKIWRLT